MGGPMRLAIRENTRQHKHKNQIITNNQNYDQNWMCALKMLKLQTDFPISSLYFVRQDMKAVKNQNR